MERAESQIENGQHKRELQQLLTVTISMINKKYIIMLCIVQTDNKVRYALLNM